MATIAARRNDSKLSSSWAEQEQVDGFDLLPVNMLACPKDVKLVCEMSGRSANIQMVTPYITLYFATRDDAEQAWSGIMHKIAPL